MEPLCLPHAVNGIVPKVKTSSSRSCLFVSMEYVDRNSVKSLFVFVCVWGVTERAGSS